ncbi:SLAC1 anion channel family protein [Mitsuaria sp. 7]|uniref:SLAC1 anion channel family protein n=1 Tax=Mitsuaria sp. 7 TaxID=1658665 RepID=UPI0007DDBD36|nr:SLAC1 anion channel family protein [Mitsuaria sp. 7]ANH68636.1 C4-dicarboxylate ABC transporter [Mitsuaria sp. 7]
MKAGHPVSSSHAGASIRHLPVNLFASVMGLSGLALAWRLAHRDLDVPAFIGEAVGALAVVVFLLMAVGYLVKLAKHPEAVRAEFHHPVGGNFFGTIAISLLLLSSLIDPYSASTAQALWTIGALGAFALAFIAVSRLLKGQLESALVMPAWLLSGVATLDIAVTGRDMTMPWAPEVTLIAGALGAMLAPVLFVMIVSRLVHREPMAPGVTPSLMMLVAPFAVGFLAYTNIVGVDRFAAVLFYFGLFLFLVIAPKVFRPCIAFSPAWWGISFPMAALASAALKYAHHAGGLPLQTLAVVLLGVLSVALAVLFVRTVAIVLNGQLFR